MTRENYIKSRNTYLHNPMNTLFELFKEKYSTNAVKFSMDFRIWIGHQDGEQVVQEIINFKDKEYKVTKMYNEENLIKVW